MYFHVNLYAGGVSKGLEEAVGPMEEWLGFSMRSRACVILVARGVILAARVLILVARGVFLVARVVILAARG